MNPYNGFPGAQRIRARKWLNAEYAAGRRQRPTRCDACTQTAGLIQAHSEDYSSPFGDHIGAYGLCYVCHMMIHCRFRAPGVWRRYQDRVRSGWRVVPRQARADWGLVLSVLRGGEFSWEGARTPAPDILDRIDPPRDPATTPAFVEDS